MKRIFFVAVATLLLAFFASSTNGDTPLDASAQQTNNTENTFRQQTSFGIVPFNEITNGQRTINEYPEEQHSNSIDVLFFGLSSAQQRVTLNPITSYAKASTVFLLAHLKQLIFPFHSYW